MSRNSTDSPEWGALRVHYAQAEPGSDTWATRSGFVAGDPQSFPRRRQFRNSANRTRFPRARE